MCRGIKRNFAESASSTSLKEHDKSSVNSQSKFQSSNPVDMETSKRLKVFYKVFEVVNKLSDSLVHQTEEEIVRADLLKKREMVSMLLKKFSEAHRQKFSAEEAIRNTF